MHRMSQVSLPLFPHRRWTAVFSFLSLTLSGEHLVSICSRLGSVPLGLTAGFAPLWLGDFCSSAQQHSRSHSLRCCCIGASRKCFVWDEPQLSSPLFIMKADGNSCSLLQGDFSPAQGVPVSIGSDPHWSLFFLSPFLPLPTSFLLCL